MVGDQRVAYRRLSAWIVHRKTAAEYQPRKRRAEVAANNGIFNRQHTFSYSNTATGTERAVFFNHRVPDFDIAEQRGHAAAVTATLIAGDHHIVDDQVAGVVDAAAVEHHAHGAGGAKGGNVAVLNRHTVER